MDARVGRGLLRILPESEALNDPPRPLDAGTPRLIPAPTPRPLIEPRGGPSLGGGLPPSWDPPYSLGGYRRSPRSIPAGAERGTGGPNAGPAMGGRSGPRSGGPSIRGLFAGGKFPVAGWWFVPFIGGPPGLGPGPPGGRLPPLVPEKGGRGAGFMGVIGPAGWILLYGPGPAYGCCIWACTGRPYGRTGPAAGAIAIGCCGC
jgi:hypothetical protein